jgi:hypothetical protein
VDDSRLSGYHDEVPGTSKPDFEALADARIDEARVLLQGGRYDGAVYLGGYAVECALKAVITKGIPAQTFPESKKDVDAWFTHRLDDLLKTARLSDELKKNPAVFNRWSVVLKWSETKRYERGTDENAARDFCAAIDDASEGVLPWLKQHW